MQQLAESVQPALAGQDRQALLDQLRQIRQLPAAVVQHVHVAGGHVGRGAGDAGVEQHQVLGQRLHALRRQMVSGRTAISPLGGNSMWFSPP